PERIVSGIGEQPAITHMRKFGLAGFTSGCVCIAPALSQQMLHAVQGGEWERAESIRQKFAPLEGLRNGIHPIRVLHAAVRLAGIANTGPIQPLLDDVNYNEEREIAEVVRSLLSSRN
ncbi:MAG: dihydrodipicolinate synthase family protein, partial [Planctomycetales bacterium]|nr:dihydrodipicolinate synthase family protein [Planctomycetales bacterium]